jgi:hypothetical protein
MVTSAPDDVSGRVPTRSDLAAAVDPAHNRLKPLAFKLIGALDSPRIKVMSRLVALLLAG